MSNLRESTPRENAMHWAIMTAMPGEDPLKVLARAQLYEEYLGGADLSPPLVLNLKQPGVDER